MTLSLIVVACLFVRNAEARIADASDLPAVRESENVEVEVDRRGHSKLVVERLIRINNDEGRETEGVQVVDFNARAMRFKILRAHTINDGKIVPVKPSAIEVRASSDSSNAFDIQKKAKVTYADLKPGSKIYLKYQIETREVAEDGFYSFFVDFNGWYIENYRLKIRSRLPLNFWKNDSEALLEVHQRESGHYLEARTTRPVRHLTVNEEEPFIRSERSLALVVSSLASWDRFAGATIARHEDLLKASLPRPLVRIKEAAAGEAAAVAKINRVAAEIAAEYRYFADWRRRRGGYVPRSLAEIAATRYGDCKDLSLIAAAILRALGLKAEIAWVVRSEPHLGLPPGMYQLPFDGFNHAIVRVEDSDAKVYWVDATEPVTRASWPPEEVAGKAAFVLRRDHPRIEMIPPLAPEGFSSEKEFRFEMRDRQQLKVDGSMTAKGRAAALIAQSAFSKNKAAIDYELMQIFAAGYRISDASVGEFAHGARIVQDLKIDFGFTASDGGLRTNYGWGVVLPREPALDRLFLPLAERGSDIFIENPGTWVNRMRLVGMRKRGGLSLDCDLQNNWIKASRKVTESDGAVMVVDRIEVLQSVLPNESLTRVEFSEFQRQLYDCFYRVALLVEPR